MRAEGEAEEVVEGEIVEEEPPAELEEGEEGEQESEPRAIEGATSSAVRNGHRGRSQLAKLRRRKAADPSGAEAKAAYWKALDRRRLGYERALERRARGRYREEGRAVEQAFASSAGEAGEDGAIAEIDRRKAGWRDLIRASHTVVVEDFGERALESIRKAVPRRELERKQFDAEDPEVVAWIEENAAESATLLTGTSRNEARKVIAAGFAEGRSVDEIARSLRSLYDERAEARALRLARTEVVRASNYGNQRGVAQSGLDYDREWVATRDDRTRDTHESADGQRVPKDVPYIIGAGHEAMYPGDPGLPGAETIMCRCVELFHPV